MDPEQEELLSPEDEWEKAEYELTDMSIQTVGLVPAGANLMNDGFILLKNQEVTGMTKDINIEEVVPEDAPDEVKSLMGMVKDGFAKIIGQYAPPDEPEPETTEGDDPAPAAEPVEETPPDPVPEPPRADDTHLDKLLKAQTDRFEALLKQQKAEFDGQVTNLKTELEKANKRAERAEQYADEQTEAAAKQASFQKAMTFKALPVKPTDLGDLLYKLEKALEGETFEQVEAVLKAADQQAFTAGLFGEVGTARTPEQVTLDAKVEKMAKEQDISYTDALLQLSPDEQRQIMEEGR